MPKNSFKEQLEVALFGVKQSAENAKPKSSSLDTTVASQKKSGMQQHENKSTPNKLTHLEEMAKKAKEIFQSLPERRIRAKPKPSVNKSQGQKQRITILPKGIVRHRVSLADAISENTLRDQTSETPYKPVTTNLSGKKIELISDQTEMEMLIQKNASTPQYLLDFEDWVAISATQRQEIRVLAKPYRMVLWYLKSLDHKKRELIRSVSAKSEPEPPKPQSLLTTASVSCGNAVPLSPEQKRAKMELEALEREEKRGLIDAHFDLAEMLKKKPL